MKSDEYIAKLEKAIAEKYGEETLEHPRSLWDEEREKEYLENLKTNYKPPTEETEKVELNGVLVSKKLVNKESNRSCPVCKSYSFKAIDDVYMNKFECCLKCYIQWVEDREERWKSGWRPNK